MFSALHHHLVAIVHHMGPWSYVALAILVMLEGPVCTVLGTAAACDGLMAVPLVFLAAALGNLCGDVAWYGLGRIAPRSWLARHCPRADVLPQFVGDVREHCRSIMMSAKLTWVFATTALVALGVARVPLRRWLWVDALAEVVWSGTLVFGGYYAVNWLVSLQRWMVLLGAGAWILVALAVFLYLRYRHPAPRLAGS